MCSTSEHVDPLREELDAVLDDMVDASMMTRRKREKIGEERKEEQEKRAN